MIWLAVALALIAVALFGIRQAGKRTRDAASPIVPPELASRLAAATRAFVDAAPWQPSAAADAPAAAAAIEAALIARDPRRALETAETALASSPSPDRDGSRIWLAWALCANAQPRAALDQLAKAGEPRDALATTGEPGDALARDAAARAALDQLAKASEPRDALAHDAAARAAHDQLAKAGEPRDALAHDAAARAAHDQLAKAGEAPELRDALARYVAARAAHLLFEHGHGTSGAIPPLITTGDLAVVTLGRGRGGAAWLTGATEVQLSAEQVLAAIAEHREVTARCLADVLDALDLAPGFADAAYLAARLAIKAGLVAEARALFDALTPRMLGRPDGDAFERDLADLADPTRAVAAARVKPLDKGQRSRSLRVLP